MSPRNLHQLGLMLFLIGWATPIVLGLMAWLVPGFSLEGGPGWFVPALVGMAFLGGLLQWLAACPSCGLSLMWRYNPDAPPLFRWTQSVLTPKVCGRCGDPLE